MKLKLKESNKEYAKILKKCTQLEMLCKHKKIKLNVLIEKKNGYENILNSNSSGNNSDLKEHKNIKKKHKIVEKEIENTNGLISKLWKELDEKKFKFEKQEKIKNELEKKLKEMETMIYQKKREMIKNLIDKLKLSIKYVTTSEF